MLALLVVLQVTLGVYTVLKRKPADIATAHQATGALLLMTSAVLLARTIRVYSFTRIRREHFYEDPIPKWLLRSFFLADYLAWKCKTLVYLSETESWLAPIPGSPLTVEQRERLRNNVEAALRCLGTNYEIL